QDWAWIAKRMRHVRGAIDGYVETLRAGTDAGIVPAIRQVEGVIEQLDAQLGAEAAAGASSESFFRQLAGEGAGARDGLARELGAGAAAADAAFGERRAFRLDELAPRATPIDAVGREAYQLASRGFLG